MNAEKIYRGIAQRDKDEVKRGVMQLFINRMTHPHMEKWPLDLKVSQDLCWTDKTVYGYVKALLSSEHGTSQVDRHYSGSFNIKFEDDLKYRTSITFPGRDYFIPKTGWNAKPDHLYLSLVDLNTEQHDAVKAWMKRAEDIANTSDRMNGFMHEVVRHLGTMNQLHRLLPLTFKVLEKAGVLPRDKVAGMDRNTRSRLPDSIRDSEYLLNSSTELEKYMAGFQFTGDTTRPAFHMSARQTSKA